MFIYSNCLVGKVHPAPLIKYSHSGIQHPASRQDDSRMGIVHHSFLIDNPEMGINYICALIEYPYMGIVQNRVHMYDHLCAKGVNGCVK